FFSVCRSLRPFFAFVFSQLVSFSAKGSSLLDRSGVANLGSIVSAFRYFLMVLRDKPVRRSISRIGKPCRKRSLRITFSSPMSITPLAPSLFAWGRVTWVKSQWKLRAYPGHFSVEINSLMERRGNIGEWSRETCREIPEGAAIMGRNGDPGRIRTPDPPLRRRLLYPTELRDRAVFLDQRPGHENRIRIGAVAGERAAFGEARPFIQHPGGNESGLDAGFQRQAGKALRRRLGHQMVQHPARQAAAAGLGQHMHRLDLGMIGLDPLEGTHGQRPTALAQHEEADAGRSQFA